MDQQYKYHAFISYRHIDNKDSGRQWATWLHQAIETYEVPPDLVGSLNEYGEEIPEYIYPVFRDEDELPAHADLAQSITRALDSTRLLIVLCSPNAVASTYVADEIDYFKKLGNSDRIIAAIIDGEPNASWDVAKQKYGFSVEDECFPEPLRFLYDDHGQRTGQYAEPIAADFRCNMDGRLTQSWTSSEAYKQHLQDQGNNSENEITNQIDIFRKKQHLMLLKIISGILGVPLSDLTQRDKQYQLEQARKKEKELREWLTRVEEQLIEANHNYGLALYERALQGVIEKRYTEVAFNCANLLPKMKPGTIQPDVYGLWLYSSSKPVSVWRCVLDKDNNSQVTGVDISNDGQKIVAGYENGDLYVVETISGNILYHLQGHRGRITGLKFSQDGLYLISGSFDNTIRLWDLGTREVIAVLDGSSTITSVDCTPDGLSMVSASADGELCVWSISTASLERKFIGHEGIVFCVRLNKQGTLLASSGIDNIIRIWDIENGEEKISFECEACAVSLEFTADGQILLAGCMNGELYFYDLTTERLEKKISAHGNRVSSLVIDRQGHRLISASYDNTIRIWDMVSGELQSTLTGHSGSVSGIALSHDGRTLLSGGWDKSVMLWDISCDENKAELIRTDKRSQGISLEKDGFRLVTYSDKSKELLIWDKGTGTLITRLAGHEGAIYCIELSAEAGLLASGSEDRTIRLWDIETGKQKGVLQGHSDTVTDVSYSANGGLLASSSYDGTVRIWDLDTAECIRLLEGGNGGKQADSSMPTAPALVANSEDWNSLPLPEWDDEIDLPPDMLFESQNDHPQAVMAGGWISCVSFSPDGQTVAAAGTDASVYIWDVTTARIINRMTAHSSWVQCVAYSPDGSKLASGSNEGRLIVQDPESNEIIFSLTHESSVESIDFSADGSRLASVSANELRIWDTGSGELIVIIKDEGNIFMDVKFSSDGNTVVTTSNRSEIRLWDIRQLSQLENPESWIEAESRKGIYYKGLDICIAESENKINDSRSINKPDWPIYHPFCWLKAAQQGNCNAQFKLADIAHKKSDYELAKYWYKKAIKGGYKDAESRLAILEKSRKMDNINIS